MNTTFKTFVCMLCDHEVMAHECPEPIHWTDGHTCYFEEREVERKESKRSNYVYFVRASIRAEFNKMSNFGRADDRLSRCVSQLVKYEKEFWWEAAVKNFESGLEYACAMHQDAIQIAQHNGFETLEQVVAALEKVCDSKFIYSLGLHNFIGS